jgi:beta-phosphoglucomutase
VTASLQAIIFDFDGVIADSEPLHLRAFQQTLREEQIDLSSADYFSRYLGFDDVGLLRALASDRGLAMSDTRLNEILVRKGARLQQMLDGDHMLFPGAADFIRDAAAEVPIAIASGALRPEILDIITGAGIGELFTTIVASGDTPQSKPSPAPYALAFEQLRTRTGRDLDPRRCVAIEDSRWGLESARGAGLRCVGVTTSYAAADLAGAELVVAGLGRLTLADLDWLCATNGHA